MLNADHIISIFFPQVSTESNLPTVQVVPDKIAEVTTEEVLEDTKKIVENKAPVLDGILNKTLLRTVKIFPNWLVQAFMACSEEDIFPEKCNQQKLVLISMLNRRLGDPSPYRPLCLLRITKIAEVVMQANKCRLLPIT